MRRMQLVLATNGVLLMWREEGFLYITMGMTLKINQVIKSQGVSKLKNTSRHKVLIY
ncbi:Uncharacterised protein [Cedecea neteri]|uniref:Uncharacterized protein n=1 Tax=Cedecea neteri TaxID=158822 RepID=A0A2X3KX86_9ENTR|nr:Uncharacterised protein [Cedecea neteri]